MRALYRGLIATMLISAIFYYPATWIFMHHATTVAKHLARLKLYGASLIGLLLTGIIVVITEYYTSAEYAPSATSRSHP